jgi:hypothetical protein
MSDCRSPESEEEEEEGEEDGCEDESGTVTAQA